MHLWKTSYDRRAHARRHELSSAGGHALFAPLLTPVFASLGVSAGVCEPGPPPEWFPLHFERSVLQFEGEHGNAVGRARYNGRLLEQAIGTRAIARGQLGGHTDFFVPLVLDDKAIGVLVVGPIALERPTASAVLERWHAITGRQGHPSDPEFAWFLSTLLETLVLEPGPLARFENLLVRLSQLMGGQGQAAELVTEAEALQESLQGVRFPERMWREVRRFVDDRSPESAYHAENRHQLDLLGVTRIPDQLLVGLTTSRRPGSDAVEETIGRNAFQRACVELALKEGDTLAGQVGDHGVVFLTGRAGSAAQKRSKAERLAERASQLARRMGFSLHAGLTTTSRSEVASKRYPVALRAAEAALSQGQGLVRLEHVVRRSQSPLGQLRRDLAKSVLESPARMQASFARYLEAVALHAGYRLDAVVTHAEVGFERMTEALLASCALDAKGALELGAALVQATTSARTIDELYAAYRGAAADLARSVLAPTAARREHGLRAALRHLHEHYGEALRAPEVAKVAGFAPKYFSRLFKQQEGVTFERYLQALRVERAKALLTDTGLDVERVAQLCGFSSAQYFCRVFRRDTRQTPLGYRRRHG